jgi:hypothetical protein
MVKGTSGHRGDRRSPTGEGVVSAKEELKFHDGGNQNGAAETDAKVFLELAGEFRDAEAPCSFPRR